MRIILLKLRRLDFRIGKSSLAINAVVWSLMAKLSGTNTYKPVSTGTRSAMQLNKYQVLQTIRNFTENNKSPPNNKRK